MRLPTLDHVFYIPLILAVGTVLGYWWGRHTLRIALAEEERAERLRADRRAQRRAEAAKKLPVDDDASVSESSSP